MKTILRAAAYLRSSSKGKGKQEMSVPEQKEQLVKFAQNKGYKIVHWYTDEGKSGSKEIRKRVAYHQLVADCTTGEFSVIVCWNISRISRQHSYDENALKKACYENRIVIDTVADGDFDFRTDMGRMKDFLLSENARKEALTISDNSIRGRSYFAEQGYWIKGTVPYGYTKTYDKGKTNKRNVYCRIVPHPEQAPVVQRIFQTLMKETVSLTQLAARLTADGIAPPTRTDGFSKGRWTVSIVRKLIRDVTYTGTQVLRAGRQKREVHKTFAPEVAHKNSHEAIVTEDTFTRVGEIIDKKNADRRKPQTQKGGILSGLLVCEKCGYRMAKRVWTTGKVVYACTAKGQGRGDCPQWAVSEAFILPKVIQWLQTSIDDEVLHRLQARPEKDDTDAKLVALDKQRATATKEIDTGVKNLLKIDDEATVGELNARIKRLRSEVEKIDRQKEFLKAEQQGDDNRRFAAWWAKQREQLVQITPDGWEAVSIPKTEVTDPDELYSVAPMLQRQSSVTFYAGEEFGGPLVYTKEGDRVFKEGGNTKILEGVRAEKGELQAFLFNIGFKAGVVFDVLRQAKKKTYYHATSVNISSSFDLNRVCETNTRPAARTASPPG